MKALLPFLFAALSYGAVVTTVAAPFGTVNQDATCTSSTFCISSTTAAYAAAEVSSPNGLPLATVDLFSWCLYDIGCGYASGSASFSDDITIPGSGRGLIEIAAMQSASDIWGTSDFSVGLPVFDDNGTHYGTRYEFTYGQPFTIEGGVSGGCSECGWSPYEPASGWVRVEQYYVSSLPDTVAAPVPEGGSGWLTGLGLVGLYFVVRNFHCFPSR